MDTSISERQLVAKTSPEVLNQILCLDRRKLGSELGGG